MMHDISLDRTTTGQGKIGEVNWHGYIDGLKTKVGDQPIPQFRDVLNLLLRIHETKPDLYMMVDIKFDNPVEILDAVHKLLESEYADKLPILKKQLTIGIWHVDFLPTTQKLFGDFRKVFIGLSLAAARKHFMHAADMMSMPFAALAGSDGQAFIQEAHAAGKKVATWTINDVNMMHTALTWQVDAIVGDHVEVMLQHCHENPTPDASYMDSYRNRIYYHLLKKAMHYGSRGYIGM